MGWLVLIHALGVKCTRVARRGLRELQRRMPPGGKIWVLWIGPTVRSVAAVGRVSRERGWETISQVKLAGPDTQIPAIKTLLRSIPRESISAVMFSGHASGWMIGGWRRPDPLMSLEEFNRYVLNRFRPRLVAWNTCLMGSMASLYGLPAYVKVALASPGLHPSKSLLYTTQAFANSTTTATVARSLQKYFELGCVMAAEWHHCASEDPVRCLLVFDVDRVKKLAPAIRQLWPNLVFDKRSQLHNTAGDGHLFDLWTASRQFPHLQREILHCVRNSTQALAHTTRTPNCRSKTCCFPCKRTRAMSVEARPPKKWLEIQARSRWTRYLGNVAKHASPKATRRATQPTHTHFPVIPRNLHPSPRRKKTP
jgi:hypothetical protein